MTEIQSNLFLEKAQADSSTVFVLGNGPSLKGVDLHKLSGFPTIGMNAAYRYWRQIDWRPTYYSCLDLVVGMSHKDAIADLIQEGRIQNFLLRSNLVDALAELGSDPRVIDFDVLRERVSLLNPPAITTGSHSTLWAASMGYSQIALMGIDGRYVELVSGAEKREGIVLEIVKQAENPNYFFDDYQQPGDRYNIPNPRPEVHAGAWRDAARKLSRGGVPVFNGNPNSEVRVFPFVSFEEFLEEGTVPHPADEVIAAEEQISVAEPVAVKQGRLTGFIRQAWWQVAAVGFLTLASVLAALSDGVASIDFAVAGIAVLAGGACSLLLYTRYVVVQHLARLQAETERVRTRLRAVERNI